MSCLPEFNLNDGVSVFDYYLFGISFLSGNKCLVMCSFHEFNDVIAGVVVFVVDLGIAEEAGVSPFFKDCCGNVKLFHNLLVGEYHFAGRVHTLSHFTDVFTQPLDMLQDAGDVLISFFHSL